MPPFAHLHAVVSHLLVHRYVDIFMCEYRYVNTQDTLVQITIGYFSWLSAEASTGWGGERGCV